MNRLKYTHYDIAFQEVPDEVTLIFNISGCPYKCEGCHSKYLWEYSGNFLLDDIDRVLGKYIGLITCVCFMGGDQNMTELIELLRKVKETYKLKTCVYSGNDDVSTFDCALLYLDYLKVGSFKQNLGGLNCETSNQNFFKVNNGVLKNITYMFRKNMRCDSIK